MSNGITVFIIEAIRAPRWSESCLGRREATLENIFAKYAGFIEGAGILLVFRAANENILGTQGAHADWSKFIPPADIVFWFWTSEHRVGCKNKNVSRYVRTPPLTRNSRFCVP